MQTVKIDSQGAAGGAVSVSGDGVGSPELTGWRDLWNYGLQLASLGIFFVTGILVTLAAPLVRMLLGPRMSREAGGALIRGLFIFFEWWLRATGMVRIEFDGVEKLDAFRGTIVAPNHPGLLDAVFLAGRLPRAVCIMRASLMRNPSFAGAANLAGYITNDRGPGLIRQCRDKLLAGDNLLIFPEGTRTRAIANGVNSFKHGFALAAVLTGAPIQTVLIERSGQYLGKEIRLLKPAKVPIHIRIRLGEKFRAAPGESAKELSQRLEAYFRAQLVNTKDGVSLAGSGGPAPEPA
jgi:1-acyl-sn-glycerol-3-phosphate acyltransferase